MVEQHHTLTWANGLHLRRAAELVQAVKPYRARVTVTVNGKSAEARSPMGLMALGAVQGSELTLRAEGPEEVEALAAIMQALAQEKG